MLSQRKRFNYNVGPSYSRTNTSKPSSSTIYTKPEPPSDYSNKENVKRIEELENVNKQLVEETARQFKKLEEDVQRVQEILAEKEHVLEETKDERENLKKEVRKIGEEKKILIQAIYQKDIVIKEYEVRVQELLKTTQKGEESDVAVECLEEGSQTDLLPKESKEEIKVVKMRNLQLEDQVFKLRQELFDANSKVKVVTQQFEAYKVLKEIESLQEQQ